MNPPNNLDIPDKSLDIDTNLTSGVSPISATSRASTFTPGNHESSLSTGLSDEELSLPRATLQKLALDYLPTDIHPAKQTTQLLMDCCSEFIHLVSTEALNIQAERRAMKDANSSAPNSVVGGTITANHVLQAMTNLGFSGYLDQIQETGKTHKQEAKIREQKKSKNALKTKQMGLSEEELLQQQQALFQQARDKYKMSLAQQPIAEQASGLTTQDTTETDDIPKED